MIKIKSLFYTIITVVVFLIGLMALPISMAILVGFVIYGIFKCLFTVRTIND